MDIQQYVDKLVAEGKITPNEIERRIEKERGNSPINSIEDMAEVVAMQMATIDSLGEMVGMLIAEVFELKGGGSNA